MTTSAPDLIVLHEHPEWQKPLFAALERRGVSFAPFDVTRAAFSNVEPPARSPLLQSGESERVSARSHARGSAGPRLHAIAGAPGRAGSERRRRVRARAEQERPGDAAAHARHRLPALDHVQRRRRSARVRRRRALAGPAEARSGRKRRAHPGGRVVGAAWRRSSAQIRPCGCRTICSCCRNICRTTPIRASSAWSFSAASFCMRCASRRTGASICARHRSAIPTKAPVCVPCRRTLASPPRRWSFFPIPTCHAEAVETAKRIVRAARLDVGGIEYLETDDGRRVFYDINANSNLRPSVAAAFGFDPFERVVDFLVRQLQRDR